MLITTDNGIIGSPAEQRTTEWLLARVGKVTASRMADVIARTKTGWGASRTNYMAELICERLTGEPYPQFTSKAMEWGSGQERVAAERYAVMSDSDVLEVGFVPHPQITNAGASPDRLVGEDGLAEFKCPNTATHISTLLGGSIPKEYITQVQFQMACTGRLWCDWVSFDPRLPPRMQMFTKRIHADPALIRELEQSALTFLDELDRTVEQLQQRIG